MMTLAQLAEYCRAMSQTVAPEPDLELWAALAVEIDGYLDGPDHDALPGLS